MITPSMIAAISIGLLFLLGILIVGFIKSCYQISSYDEVLIRSGGGKMRCFGDGTGCFVIPGIHQLLRLKMKDLLIDVDSPWDVFFSKDGDNIYIRTRLSLRPRQETLNDILQALKAFGVEESDSKGPTGRLYLDEKKVGEVAKAILVSELGHISQGFTTDEILRNPNILFDTSHDIKHIFETKYGLRVNSMAIIMTSLKERKKEISDISLISLDVAVECPYCKAEINKDEGVDCQDCKTAHHAECFSENQECSVFACGSQKTKVKA